MNSLFPMDVHSDDFRNSCLLDWRTVGPGRGDDDGGLDVVDGALEDDGVTVDEEMVWFSSDLLSYQPLLNDCMLSQSSSLPVVSDMKDVMLSTCGQSFRDQEFEQDLLTLVNPNMAMTLDKDSETSLTLGKDGEASVPLDKDGETSSQVEELSSLETVVMEPCVTESSADEIECLVEEKVIVSPVPSLIVSSGVGTRSTYVLTYRPSKNSVLKPQTITLSSHVQTPLEISEKLSHKLPDVSKVQIRVMPCTTAPRVTGVTVCPQGSIKNLPLSPPNSDSDGSISPVRSERLNITQTSFPQNLSPPRPKIMSHSSLLGNSMSSSGSLFLSEEEERTLISEGYPVPTKWPLTKQEEKILKKIQRKIKNKVSAQESRRKKKDYIDSLEKRLEASSMENSSLKKKVEKLEHGNRVLMSQIEKLKKAVHSVSAQSSTYIMVFVLCFAICLGVWSPLTSTHLSPGPALGLHESQQLRNLITSDLLSSDSQVVKESSDYKTPSMKSRTLLSVLEDPEESFETPSASTCYSGLLDWLRLLPLVHKHRHCEQEPGEQEPDGLSATPLIVATQGQNPVGTSPENQTDWQIKEQNPMTIDRIYVSDFIAIPASES